MRIVDVDHIPVKDEARGVLAQVVTNMADVIAVAMAQYALPPSRTMMETVRVHHLMETQISG